MKRKLKGKKKKRDEQAKAPPGFWICGGIRRLSGGRRPSRLVFRLRLASLCVAAASLLPVQLIGIQSREGSMAERGGGGGGGGGGVRTLSVSGKSQPSLLAGN